MAAEGGGWPPVGGELSVSSGAVAVALVKVAYAAVKGGGVRCRDSGGWEMMILGGGRSGSGVREAPGKGGGAWFFRLVVGRKSGGLRRDEGLAEIIGEDGVDERGKVTKDRIRQNEILCEPKSGNVLPMIESALHAIKCVAYDEPSKPVVNGSKDKPAKSANKASFKLKRKGRLQSTLSSTFISSNKLGNSIKPVKTVVALNFAYGLYLHYGASFGKTSTSHIRVFFTGSDGQAMLAMKLLLTQLKSGTTLGIGYVRAHTHDVRASTIDVPIDREDDDDSVHFIVFTFARRRVAGKTTSGKPRLDYLQPRQ
ncbi:hypothetical protein Tco_0888917 [Tanacetum coccineum]